MALPILKVLLAAIDVTVLALVRFRGSSQNASIFFCATEGWRGGGEFGSQKNAKRDTGAEVGCTLSKTK